jgi:septation ring formation regulator EzrA
MTNKSILDAQVATNTSDITDIKQNIATIMSNHLHHIEKDMEKVKTDTGHLKDKITEVDRKVEKMDNRLFWILGLLIIGIVVPAFIQGLNL